jgi:hypothetical protein
MCAQLQSEDVARWQQARDALLRLLEVIKVKIEHERCAHNPDPEKLEGLEAQLTFVTDARYELSVHDEDTVAAVFEGRITFRGQEVCIYPVAARSVGSRSKSGSCQGICVPRDRFACQLLRDRSLTFPYIDTYSRSLARTSL